MLLSNSVMIDGIKVRFKVLPNEVYSPFAELRAHFQLNACICHNAVIFKVGVLLK
jgi:hypothetical protein